MDHPVERLKHVQLVHVIILRRRHSHNVSRDYCNPTTLNQSTVKQRLPVKKSRIGPRPCAYSAPL